MVAGERSVSDPFGPQRRFHVTPLVELVVLVVATAVAAASYNVINAHVRAQQLLQQGLVAGLLVANLVPGVALMILLGRRIAHRRAARSPIGGEGQLHVRLVALFSVMAAVPMLLVALAASLLLQYGIEFSSSTRARAMFGNATSLARDAYKQELGRVVGEVETMSGDLGSDLGQSAIDRRSLYSRFAIQLYRRNLSEGLIAGTGLKEPLAISPYGEPLDRVIRPEMKKDLDAGAPFVTVEGRGRIGVLAPLAGKKGVYIYAARVFDPQLADQLKRGEAVLADYRALQARSRALQLRFNAALLAVSLLIVGIAVWIALAVADRLVAPVAELVDAARRVEGGDLTARVTAPRTRDEVGTLANAFNQMTGRLQQQNSALVSANEQLDSRRVLIEAVMGGVSAGVISVSTDRTVRIINRSAMALLDIGASPVGRSLVDVAPELDGLIDGTAREAVVEVQAGAEQRTLAVRVARAEAGPILTFDDVTQQLRNQRLAAWSDVARRIAHEIKNPLTPIQLAAERLQRRYGKNVEAGDTTFARLTETIIRQVGDLRRMVDEFSSFVRMPKPAFREELLVDIARQSLFLHEVAHPAVRFDLVHRDPGPVLVCDRRQIGQALTNIVKNAVEAIEAKGEGGAVVMTLAEAPGRVCVEVADTGIGLPAERDRIVEPYMTTRARGTGLGLAIVKKIVEEHAGVVDFSDRTGGGTVVRMTFDTAELSAFDTAVDRPPDLSDDGQIATLSRIRI